jgi:hypothetical protein
MRNRLRLGLLATLCAAGCATTAADGRGWSGNGAEPFDGARDACEADASAIPAGRERTASFEACMAARGWHRR